MFVLRLSVVVGCAGARSAVAELPATCGEMPAKSDTGRASERRTRVYPLMRAACRRAMH